MGVANHPINRWRISLFDRPSRRRAAATPGTAETTREPKPLTLKEVYEQGDATPHLFSESADGIRVHRDPAAVKQVSTAMESADASLFQ